MKRFGSITIQLISLLGLVLAIAGCQKESGFKVSGHVSGASDQTLYLEHQALTGIEVVDSVKLKEGGKFSFTHPQPEYPDFYRLRLEKQTIPFPVDSTTNLNITADAASFATSYTIEGSDQAQKMKDIWLAQLDANLQVSKLMRQYNKSGISTAELNNQLDSLLSDYKKKALNYIYTEPGSQVAYFALFQQINEMLIFNPYDPEDSKAFAAVANSYDMYYPESPRTKHLYDLALKSIAVVRAQRRQADRNQAMVAKVDSISGQDHLGYYDITLPDMDGRDRTLSKETHGAAVLLCFTAMAADWSPSLIHVLESIYERYHEQGLKIFMVSLDSETHIWKSAVDRLPWINVRDRDSSYSQLIGMYNLQSLPTLFLINKQGDLVKRLESLEEVPTEVEKIL